MLRMTEGSSAEKETDMSARIKISARASEQMAAGPLYLVWFPLLARDFARLARGGATE